MFSNQIVGSDPFVEMPLSSQALYFHLGMQADDDGFVGSPRKIQRMIGANDDDLKLLIAKRFILAFESGIIVIKHFRMQNTLQNDRYKPTFYQRERSMLIVKDNKAYTEAEKVEIPAPIPEWKQDGNIVETEWKHNLTKHNLTKHNITENRDTDVSLAPTSETEVSTELVPVPEDDPSQEVIFKLPLQSTKEHPLYHPVTVSDLDHYRDLYPAVDVEQAIRSMIGWCEANPAKRKTARGAKAFITNWLSREQNRGGTLRGRSEQARANDFTQALGDIYSREVNDG
jgi:hypothetical protein